MPNQDGRGGPRPGAGRPALPDQILTTFRLTAEQRANLDALGAGNMNEGLRALVDGDIAAECLELRRELQRIKDLIARFIYLAKEGYVTPSSVQDALDALPKP